MTAQQMWELYGKTDTPYEVWAFGDAPDELAALVLAGTKTATSSAFALYELSGEPLPKTGDCSVILDSRGEAVCIIRNTHVTVLPYREIGETRAFLEGEGDRSLDYWRQVHERFFRTSMERAGLAFSQDMLVVFEEFERTFP